MGFFAVNCSINSFDCSSIDLGSWICSTPAYSDGKLYVGGMVDLLLCQNAEDGSEV